MLPLFDPPIVKRAIKDSFKKLDPRWVARNPVMFVGGGPKGASQCREPAWGRGNLHIYSPDR